MIAPATTANCTPLLPVSRRKVVTAMLMAPLAAMMPHLAQVTTATSGTSNLAPDERLYQNELLRSPNGLYSFEMQQDGNAVIYGPGHVAIWADTRTAGHPGAWLLNQASDGNLVLRDRSGVPLWHTHTNGRGSSSLVMQDDGNLVLYTNTNPRIHTWASNTVAIPTAPETAGFNAGVFALVNAQRRAYGLSPLGWNHLLANAAQRYAVDMAAYNYISHTGRDGSSSGDRIAREGYRFSNAGENLARGFTSSEAVVTAWMNSPGHRANILGRQFTEIGLGYYNGYWVQTFGRPQ